MPSPFCRIAEGNNVVHAEITSLRIAGKLAIQFLVMATAFFGSAGTFLWPEAWFSLVLQFSFSTFTMFWMKKHDPELLRERMIFLKPGAHGWDKAFILGGTAVFVPYLLLPGLDAVRYGWSAVPPSVARAAFLGIVVSLAVYFRVIRENRYLTGVIEIQQERGHRVVDTGPYRCVRHPMYSGAIMTLFSLPLALGSLWALIPASLLTVMLLVRTHFEDRMLHAELEGYRDYAKRTRHRIIPGVWRPRSLPGLCCSPVFPVRHRVLPGRVTSGLCRSDTHRRWRRWIVLVAVFAFASLDERPTLRE